MYKKWIGLYKLETKKGGDMLIKGRGGLDPIHRGRVNVAST